MSRRKSRYHFKEEKKEGTNLFTNIVIIIVIVVFFSWSWITSVIQDNWPRNYYLKQLQVCGATIVEKSNEDSGRYYIRVYLTQNQPQGEIVGSDDSWIGVQKDFYITSSLNDNVGVLMSKYDIYKKRLLSSKQDFEKSAWAVEEIYNSYEEAQQANPYKKFNAKAIIKKKKTTKTGNTYFVLEEDQRTLTVQVTQEIYSKYKANDKIECEFESLGESLKCLKVIG